MTRTPQTHISLNLVSLSSGSLDCKLFFFNLKSSLKKRKRRSNAESCSGFITRCLDWASHQGAHLSQKVHLLQVNVCQKQTALLPHTHYCCLVKLTSVLCEGFHVTHVSCLCMLVFICCVIIDMPYITTLILGCQLRTRQTSFLNNSGIFPVTFINIQRPSGLWVNTDPIRLASAGQQSQTFPQIMKKRASKLTTRCFLTRIESPRIILSF